MPETSVLGLPFERKGGLPGATLSGGKDGQHPILAQVVEEYLLAIVRESDVITPADAQVSSASTFEQYGSDDIAFANPQRAVKVKAWASCNLDNATTNTAAMLRIGISLDGGSSFDYGTTPTANVGTTTDTRRGILHALHLRSGTPTGSVLVRLEHWASDVDVEFEEATLMAEIDPVVGS